MALTTASGKPVVSSSKPVRKTERSPVVMVLAEEALPPFGVKAKRRHPIDDLGHLRSLSDCRQCQHPQNDRTDFMIENVNLFSVKKSEVVLHEPEGLLAALEYCQANSPNGFTINGSDEFKRRCAQLAVKYDFNILNPEIQSMMGELREHQDASENISTE